MDILSSESSDLKVVKPAPTKPTDSGNVTARKMLFLAVLFVGGIVAMAMLPESIGHFVSPLVMMGILWVLFTK